MKAIITDLDRTLLHSDKTLSEYTIKIMQRCHEAGFAVLAATARPERSVLPYHKQICFNAVTTMNGARIILSDRVLENGISHLSGELILSRLVLLPDALISIETSEGLYSNAEIPEWNPKICDSFPKLPTAGTLYKILVSSRNDSLYENVKNVLTDDTYYTIANNDLVQIMSNAATKWNGIKIMLESLGIPLNEAVYFGDDQDDLDSIRMCGIGVAVSNAIQSVIQAADYVTGSNDEDGVAHFLEMHLLSQA